MTRDAVTSLSFISVSTSPFLTHLLSDWNTSNTSNTGNTSDSSNTNITSITSDTNDTSDTSNSSNTSNGLFCRLRKVFRDNS